MVREVIKRLTILKELKHLLLGASPVAALWESGNEKATDKKKTGKHVASARRCFYGFLRPKQLF